jgi:tRNA pseudouridine55 synthase
VGKSKSADGQLADAKLVTNAFLNVNKPKGITSHDVVARVRKLTGLKQVGHAGTLDPMAEGVMIIALGKACRLLRFLADDKSYKATITLGLVTDTDDIEGKVLEQNTLATTSPPSQAVVSKALQDFIGSIEQIPPYYSAIHVDGKRLYEMARAGLAPPEIKARPVTIHSLDLLSYEAPTLTIRVHCSKGTYIRSIARDLGQKLGLGGTLSALVRETSGTFTLDQCSTLEDLAGSGGLLKDRLVKVEDALNLPALLLSAASAKRLSMGQKIGIADLEPAAASQIDSSEYFLVVNALTGNSFCVCRTGRSELDGQKYLAPEVVFEDV